MAHILVVDDTPGIIDLLLAILSVEGHDVSEAVDGTEALEQFKEVRPDGVFLDLGLPDVDGFTVLGQILEVDPNARVTILTGNLSKDLTEEALSLGAIGFLTKPFTRQTFLAALNEMIG